MGSNNLKKEPKRDQNPVTAAQIRKEHLAQINSVAKKGKIIMTEPFKGDGDVRGIIVSELSSMEKVKDLHQRIRQ
jgi:hypothetical protein